MMPAKTPNEHALHGTEPGALVEETSTAGLPPVPRDLQPDEKKIFRAARKTLAARRTLTAGDQQLLRLLAIAVARHRRACTHLAAEGEIVDVVRLNNHGEEVRSQGKNLWLGIAEKAAAEITGLCDRLGLTPLNRSRVRKVNPEEAEGGIIFH